MESAVHESKRPGQRKRYWKAACLCRLLVVAGSVCSRRGATHAGQQSIYCSLMCLRFYDSFAPSNHMPLQRKAAGQAWLGRRGKPGFSNSFKHYVLTRLATSTWVFKGPQRSSAAPQTRANCYQGCACVVCVCVCQGSCESSTSIASQVDVSDLQRSFQAYQSQHQTRNWSG